MAYSGGAITGGGPLFGGSLILISPESAGIRPERKRKQRAVDDGY
jgi:hypothetical protein